jgi:hypothetical protein
MTKNTQEFKEEAIRFALTSPANHCQDSPLLGVE